MGCILWGQTPQTPHKHSVQFPELSRCCKAASVILSPQTELLSTTPSEPCEV